MLRCGNVFCRFYGEFILFLFSNKRLLEQRRFQNSPKPLRLSAFWKSLTIFAKHSILDAWKGSQYTSDNIKKLLKMNNSKKKILNHKNNITRSNVSLFPFYLDFLKANYCHYIGIAVKMKNESVILLSNRIYLPSFETFKARVLEFEFKFPLPKVKFSQCLEWKNEWNHRVPLRFFFFFLLKKSY